MGVLANKINNPIKVNVPYTVLRIVDTSDGRETVSEIIDEQFSIKGLVVYTIELPSFDATEELASLYNGILGSCFRAIEIINKLIRVSRLDLLVERPELIQKIFFTV